MRHCVEIDKKYMYESDEIRVSIVLDMVPQISPGHPLRDKLKRIERDSLEGDDIWVIQVFPHHSLFAELLRSLSGDGYLAEAKQIWYLFNILLIGSDSYPKSFDADSRAEGPFVSVTEPARRVRRLVERYKSSRQLIGCRENFSRATYLPQYIEALSR